MGHQIANIFGDGLREAPKMGPKMVQAGPGRGMMGSKMGQGRRKIGQLLATEAFQKK